MCVAFRERNDEGHREVASILQSPADWLSSEAGAAAGTGTGAAAARTVEGFSDGGDVAAKEGGGAKEDQGPAEPKGGDTRH